LCTVVVSRRRRRGVRSEIGGNGEVLEKYCHYGSRDEEKTRLGCDMARKEDRRSGRIEGRWRIEGRRGLSERRSEAGQEQLGKDSEGKEVQYSTKSAVQYTTVQYSTACYTMYYNTVSVRHSPQ
jgi:hypothetical protein